MQSHEEIHASHYVAICNSTNNIVHGKGILNWITEQNIVKCYIDIACSVSTQSVSVALKVDIKRLHNNINRQI